MDITGENLKGFKPFVERKFLGVDDNLGDWAIIEKYYKLLLDKVINSSNDLEQWIFDRSEFEAAVDQHSSVLYILMTCQTDDEQRAKAYSAFIENVIPAMKPYEQKLDLFLLDKVRTYPVNEKRYGIYLRKIEQDVKLFREENIALETEVDLLSQEYQAICGKMTVEFNGTEHTLPQMEKYLHETDRVKRETAWRAISQRRLKDKDKLNSIFDRMFYLRNQIAKNCGFDNYRDYKFKALHRFDYLPEDCKKYHEAIEKFVVPVWIKILERRRNQMKLNVLRPWDTAVDPLGREALKPFTEIDRLIAGCNQIFAQVDPELGGQFKQMREHGLLDLASRKGKAPGGYQSTLNETRKPFIFMNAVGLDSDVRTLLHEGGHAFHAFACSVDPLLDYRHAPMEFCEVASMGMELLGGEFLSEFYSADEFLRSKIEHWEDVVFILVWVAVVDSFQHWMYENPGHTSEDRRKKWIEIRSRFGSQAVDWSGLDEEQTYLWHRQLHIFEVPFYYIEYGIAQLGALQIWLNFRKDFKLAVQCYKQALALGGSCSLMELFAAADIKFDFSDITIRPLLNAVDKEIF
ncbi:MAG: M3 family oligoendopeptidase [Candidatus Omnitrophica bacterium]|nr:M3 family oligoendopeptidase [Candidatus Omnitrophota bacterium]